MSHTSKHINQKEREFIAIGKAKGLSFRAIAAELDRAHTTISREYKRNLNDACFYSSSGATELAKARKIAAAKRASKCEPYTLTIEYLLCIGWTPAQIAGHLSHTPKVFSVSHETIYEFIYSYHVMWAKLLPRAHVTRWNKGMGKKRWKNPMISNRISILERPWFINDKVEFGHWEGDSIVCSQSIVSLNVMAERQTQYVTITRVENRGPGATRDAMIDRLGRFKKRCRRSITLDNGIEFKWHEQVKDALKLDTYFCQPYHSWEKGLVEQINGLIRRFLPKKTDLSQVSDKEIKLIEYLLNSRPRKLLNWKTPAEVFAKKSKMKLVSGALAT